MLPWGCPQSHPTPIQDPLSFQHHLPTTSLLDPAPAVPSFHPWALLHPQGPRERFPLEYREAGCPPGSAGLFSAIQWGSC